MESKRHAAGRWIALTLVVVVVAAWGGAIAGAAPSSITTCTKTSNHKTKIIVASGVAKCTAKGKGTAKTWDAHSIAAALLAPGAPFKASSCTFVAGMLGHPGLVAVLETHSLADEAAVLQGYCTPLSSIRTCTKTSNQKTKVIATSGIAKCTARGKGTTTTWDDHTKVQALLSPTFVQRSCTFFGANIGDNSIEPLIEFYRPDLVEFDFVVSILTVCGV